MKLVIYMVFLWSSCYTGAQTVAAPQDNPPAETILLSTLDVSRIEQGWGQGRSNRSVDNRRLTIAGKRFENGIGTHANSNIPLLLEGNGINLSGGAGLDDETNGRGSVVFHINADEKEIWSSGLMRPGDAAKEFSLDVKGVKSLVLLASDGGDGYDYDHADWVDLKITMISNSMPKLDIPPIEDAVILTPKPAPAPRINGAKIFGVRPGSPFLFRIAATGDRPMTFSADGLPSGLNLNAQTGQITGTLENAGEYKVTLRAKNALGQAEREFKVVCGSQIGLTPAMGWNSWNCFASAVTAEKIKAAADAMTNSGLIDHGWTYINIDDFWQVHRDSKDATLQGPKRDADGWILPNPRFPDMKGLADYVHGKGLKIGIYSVPGPWTCGGCVGSFDHELQDARQYAEWGFDYLKYDWCSYNPAFEAYRGSSEWDPDRVPNIQYSGGDHPTNGRIPFKRMQEALIQQPRDIIYSLCQYGMGNVWEWGTEVGGNSWRTTQDINDSWGSMSSIGFGQNGREKYAGPGHFNDPDMLVIGKVGWGPQLRNSRLSPNEQYTHISLWCLLASPLLIGCDMTQLDEFTLNLLTNDEVLEVNQDPLGRQAARVVQDGNLEVWAKDMEDGSKAVGLFNRGTREQPVTVQWSDLGITGEQLVRDLWRQKDIGKYAGHFEASVGRHGVVLVKIAPLIHLDRGASAKPSAQFFPLKDVRLLESPFSEAVKANRKYLLAHDPDRLLAPFRREAGLESKAQPYGNWESMGLDGHTAGHYLSALALMTASGADPDGECLRRLNYMIDELEQVQNSNRNGYLGGVAGSNDYWRRVAEGDVELMRSKWVPWYNLHKTYAGLRDAYIHGGNEKARDLLIGFGDWCEKVTSGLTDAQMQRMLETEYGGMNEVLADIYAITGNKKYIELAKRFNHRAFFEHLENREDRLTGLHANTQIPKIVGMERVAALVQDKKLHTGAAFFWERVTQHRSVVFGGNSVSEHFNDPKDFSGMIEHREGPESCNTYNMLRLTEELFKAEPRAVYADYYERALYNHVLASMYQAKPGYVYFTPIRPDHYRVYSQPEVAFWCCVGTGMENPGRYGEFIYARSNDEVYVNLFIPSELTASEFGTVLTQQTKFPDEAHTQIHLHVEKPTTFTLNIRHPAWVNAGDFVIKVNGGPVDFNSIPSSYAAIRREWVDGDTVDVELPMHLRTERLPDGSDWVAFLYGPIVLTKPDGTDNMDGLFADGGRMSQVAHGPTVPLDKVPVLLAAEDDLLAHVVPDPSAGPLHFRIMDVVEPAKPGGLPLVPFFRLHEQRYQMYWELTTADRIADRTERLAAEERARQAREAATIDWVAVGEQQSEVEHDLKGEGMDSGIHNGRRWRHGSCVQYTLDPRGAKEIILSVTYSGDDRGREFDILINERVISVQKLTGEKPNNFIEKRYPIPSEILQAAGSGRLTVRFSAKQWLAGGLYDVRLLKPDVQQGPAN